MVRCIDMHIVNVILHFALSIDQIKAIAELVDGNLQYSAFSINSNTMEERSRTDFIVQQASNPILTLADAVDWQKGTIHI